MSAGRRQAVLSRACEQMRTVLTMSAESAQPEAAGVEAMRSAYVAERSRWNRGGPTTTRTPDTTVGTPHGPVRIRVHAPLGRQASDMPGLVFIHGGGFVVGNLDTHDRIMRNLAVECEAVVVGIDYALSPEAKFPVAVEQCVALVGHLREHGTTLGIDPGRIGLAGDSGGAMLALATHLYLRDELGAADVVKALLLYYGLYGLRDSASRRLLGGEWDGLSKADLAYYMDSYLARPEDADSPYVDCLDADLTWGVPPSYVVAAELDPLLDDSFALVQILASHGHPHRYQVFPGVLHAFLHYSEVLDAAVEAMREGGRFFRQAVDLVDDADRHPTPTTEPHH